MGPTNKPMPITRTAPEIRLQHALIMVAAIIVPMLSDMKRTLPHPRKSFADHQGRRHELVARRLTRCFHQSCCHRELLTRNHHSSLLLLLFSWTRTGVLT